jgi:hypothetical protein
MAMHRGTLTAALILTLASFSLAEPATQQWLPPVAWKVKDDAPLWARGSLDQWAGRRENKAAVFRKEIARIQASSKMTAAAKKTSIATFQGLLKPVEDPKTLPPLAGEPMSPEAYKDQLDAYGECNVEVLEVLDPKTVVANVAIGGRRGGEGGKQTRRDALVPADAPIVRAVVTNVSDLKVGAAPNLFLLKNGTAKAKANELPAFTVPDIKNYLEPVK